MRELKEHRHVQVVAEHGGCTWQVCLEKGWKEETAAFLPRGDFSTLIHQLRKVILKNSRAVLSNQSVSISSNKMFRYLVFFPFSMLNTL